MGRRWLGVVAALVLAFGVLTAGAAAPVSAWDDGRTDSDERLSGGSDDDSEDPEEISDAARETVEGVVHGTTDGVSDGTDRSTDGGGGDATAVESSGTVGTASNVTAVLETEARIDDVGSVERAARAPGTVTIVATLGVGGTDVGSLSARAGRVTDRTPPVETGPPTAPLPEVRQAGPRASLDASRSTQGSALDSRDHTARTPGDRGRLRATGFQGSREHAGPDGRAADGSVPFPTVGEVISKLVPFVGVPVSATAVPFWAVVLVLFLKPVVGALWAAAAAASEYAGRVASALRFGNAEEEPLAHDLRARLVERVETSPGLTLTELADRSDASLSSVRYHLRVLEAERLLASEKIHGNRRFFPQGAVNEALLAALADEPTGTILRELRAREAASVGEIVGAVDRSYSTVSYHLDRLSDDGLVVQAKEGKRKLTRLAPWVRAALETDPADPQQRSGHDVGAD